MFVNDEMEIFIEAVHKYKSYECYKRIAASILTVSHFRCKNANRKHGFVCGTPNIDRQKHLMNELKQRYTQNELTEFIIYLENLNDETLSNEYVEIFLNLLKMTPIIPIKRNRAFDEICFQKNKEITVSVLENLKKRGTILNYDFQEEHIVFFKPLLSKAEMLIQIGVDAYSIVGRVNGKIDDIQNHINVIAAASLLTNDINCDDRIIGKWIFNSYSGSFLYCLKNSFDFSSPENIELMIECAISEFNESLPLINDFISETKNLNSHAVIVRQDIIEKLLGKTDFE